MMRQHENKEPRRSGLVESKMCHLFHPQLVGHIRHFASGTSPDDFGDLAVESFHRAGDHANLGCSRT